jgi:hypothetical protein
MQFLTFLVFLVVAQSCAIFGDKSDDGESIVEPLESSLLVGQWVEKKRFDLLNGEEVSFTDKQTKLLLITEDSFSQLDELSNPEECIDQKSYELQGRRLVISADAVIQYEVKGLDATNMSLLVIGTTGTAVYEHLYQQIDVNSLKARFSGVDSVRVCPAFSGFASSGSNGSGGDDIFKPSIDLEKDYSRLALISDLSVPESKTDSGVGYVRFTMEGGQTYKPGTQPGIMTHCEFNFANLFQIQKSGGNFLFTTALQYKVLQLSRNKLSDGSSNVDILLDGLQLQCNSPGSEEGVSDAAIKKAIGQSISLK